MIIIDYCITPPEKSVNTGDLNTKYILLFSGRLLNSYSEILDGSGCFSTVTLTALCADSGRECVKGESAAAAAVAAAPACLPPQHGVARSLCQRCPTSIALQRLREKRLTHDGLCLIYPPEVSSNAPAAPLLLFCSRQRGRKKRLGFDFERWRTTPRLKVSETSTWLHCG